jgi:4-alpha-glucanotransferase
VQALVQAGLLPPDYSPSPPVCPEEVRRAVLAYLGKSRAALVEVRLEDMLGLTAQQNLPGTTDQHPNWRHKIFQTLEELRRPGSHQNGGNLASGPGRRRLRGLEILPFRLPSPPKY